MSSTHELGTHEEVESRLCNAQALVPNRNRHLPPERDPSQAKLHDESFFVDRFEEARPRWRLTSIAAPITRCAHVSSSPPGSLAFLVILAVHPFGLGHVGGAVAGLTRSLTQVVLTGHLHCGEVLVLFHSGFDRLAETGSSSSGTGSGRRLTLLRQIRDQPPSSPRTPRSRGFRITRRRPCPM